MERRPPCPRPRRGRVLPHDAAQRLVARDALGRSARSARRDRSRRRRRDTGSSASRAVIRSAAPQNCDSTSTPGSAGSCAATYSFATRFMPSRSGVTRPTVGEPVQPRERVLIVRAIEVAHGRPVGLAERAVDPADERLDARAQLGVLGNLGARRHRDLDERDLAAPLGVPLEQPRERLEPLGDALGVVEAIDAEDQLAAARASSRTSRARSSPVARARPRRTDRDRCRPESSRTRSVARVPRVACRAGRARWR